MEPERTRDAFIEAACVPLEAGHGSGTLDEAVAILAAHHAVLCACQPGVLTLSGRA